MKVAYSDIYKYELPDGHRFPMEKYPLIREQLIYEGTLEASDFYTPTPLTWSQVGTTHTSDYIEKLQTTNLSTKEIRKIGFPLKQSLVDRGLFIAGGTYQNALYAMTHHSVALNIAGGTHHSFANHGEGFCIYNDFAIASNLLIQHHGISSILIVDLDVHQGNGTAHIFEKEDRVYTFSMHGARNYPTKKMVSDLDIGLTDGTEDAEFLAILYDTLPRLIEERQPEIIMYLAGVDVLTTDKLGRLSMTKYGAMQRDEFVLSQASKHNIPIIVSLGGGYSHRLIDIVDAHANTFRVAKDIYK